MAAPMVGSRAMAAITDKLRLFVTPWMSVRHKSKPNIQRPRHPHWQRLKMLRTCQPIFPVLDDETCSRAFNKPLINPSEQETRDYPYAQILSKILFHSIRESGMLAIFHKNSIGMDDFKVISNSLKKNDMKVLRSNKLLAKMALEDTRYSALLNVIGPHTTLVSGREPRVDKLLRLLKKMPQLVLLGGMVEDRLLSKEEMEAYGKLPNIDSLRQRTVQILQTASGQINRTLLTHQSELSRCLDHVKTGKSDVES